jgi:SAM-dependent methyltransferase
MQPGATILDAGCGVGLSSRWLAEQVGASGLVVGCDLSGPHLQLATSEPGDVRPTFVQCDIGTPPFQPGTFDLIWCANTINHLRDPVEGVRQLAATLRPGGRIALLQSGFLPDMFFAWDERLEREVTRAVRHYYRDKYGLSEQATTGMRGLVGLVQRAGLPTIETATIVIERTQPLSDVDRDYLHNAVFTGYWGERLRPYLVDADWAGVQKLCDPSSPEYALKRSDFHHLQTLTMVVGRSDA